MEVEYLPVSALLWVLVQGLVAYFWVGETGAFPLVGKAGPESRASFLVGWAGTQDVLELMLVH